MGTYPQLGDERENMKLKDILAGLIGVTITQAHIDSINASVDEIKTKAIEETAKELEELKTKAKDRDAKLKTYESAELKAKFIEEGGNADRFDEFVELGGNAENVKEKLSKTEYFKAQNKEATNTKDITQLKGSKPGEKEQDIMDIQLVSGGF